MTAPDLDGHIRGETAATFQPSTMSSLEARAFASSDDAEQEIRGLVDDAERGSITARIRIGGLLTGLGPKRWREARKYWLEALDECEWLLGDFYEPRLQGRAASSGFDHYDLENAAGAVSGMLGELALHLEREKEAITHLERGVHYHHSESSLRLALLQKARGRYDRAQFLLTSFPGRQAPDATYLLGDLFESQGRHDLAGFFYRRAAAEGHSRAASRFAVREIDDRIGDSIRASRDGDPYLVETIEYGYGWSASIEHFHGGLTISWGDTEVDDLLVITFASGLESDIASTSPNIYEELEAHQTVIADHRTRTFAVGNATKSALILERSSTNHTDAGVEVGIADRRTGSVELQYFDTVREALEFLRIIAPLDADRAG